MPTRRLLVRKIREVLRLKHERGLSHRAIAQACAIGVGTVSLYLQRIAQQGLGWPLPAELDDAALEARLFRRAAPAHDRVRPDCAYIHRELKRDGVTLQLLWEEYAQVHPHGYRRAQFCEIYRQWARRLRPSMRQVHRAGEKTFIDFSGKRPALVDPRTGDVRRVELLVAVLGASSFTYAEATTTQQLPDWVDAHTRMVEYYGGTTAVWVPDQLKSAITRPCRYEPGVNRTYEDLATHYGAVVVPARPRKPRDKVRASYYTPSCTCDASFGYRRRSRNRFPGWATGSGPVGGSKSIVPLSSARTARSTPSCANRLAVLRCTSSCSAICGAVSQPAVVRCCK